MRHQPVAFGFLSLYATPLEGVDLLAKSVRSTSKKQAMNVVVPPRDKHGRYDYHAVPIGARVWVEINRPEHPLHHQHVLVERTADGFRVAGSESLENVRGSRADVEARRKVLAEHDDDARRQKVKKEAAKLKEDSAQDPFAVLAGGLTPVTRVVHSPWDDEDEVTKSVEMAATPSERPQDGRNGSGGTLLLTKAHDVSGEARDKYGRWAAVWKPVMTRAEAEAWSKGTSYPADLYHVTTAKAAHSIEKEGFRLDTEAAWGRLWGRGVYLATDTKTANSYQDEYHPVVLTVRAKLRKILTVKPTLRMIEDESPGRVIALAIPGGGKEYPDIYRELVSSGKDGSGALEELLRRHGYDAVYIHDPKVREGIGGNQLLVPDPKDLTVVKSLVKSLVEDIGDRLIVLDPHSLVVLLERSAEKSIHDVSGELRDEKGRWTKGAGSSPKETEEFPQPRVGDVYASMGKGNEFTIVRVTSDFVTLKNFKTGKRLRLAYPDSWRKWNNFKMLKFVREDTLPDSAQEEHVPAEGDRYNDTNGVNYRVLHIDKNSGWVTLVTDDDETVPVDGDTWKNWLDTGYMEYLRSGEAPTLPADSLPPALSAPDRPVIGDRFSFQGYPGVLWRLSRITHYQVEFRNEKGQEISLAYPSQWNDYLKDGTLALRQTAKDAREPEAWQKTKAQFVAENPDEAWRHENAVLNALRENKPVPDEVLKDYPDAKQSVKHADYDFTVRDDPKGGMEVRVVNPKSPDFGRIFRVTGVRLQQPGDDYIAGGKAVQLVRLGQKTNEPVGLPFELPLGTWRNMFPSWSIEGPYADALPAKWENIRPFDYTFAAYLPGDRPLPDPTGQKVAYQDPAASELIDAQAKVRKARVVKLLSDRLEQNPAYLAWVKKQLLDAYRYQANPSSAFPIPVREEAQRKLDSPLEPQEVRKRVEIETNDLVRAWAATSADASPISLALQRAAADVFGLDATQTRTPWTDDIAGDANDQRYNDQWYQENGAAYREFIKAEYALTQEFFAQHGIKEVKLYRGYRDFDKAPVPNGPVVLKMQPLSSFSTAQGVARVFASYSESISRVITATVPVKDILCTPFTGSGCLSEREALVIGRPLRGEVFDPGEETDWVHGRDQEDPAMAKLWDDGEFGKSLAMRRRALSVDRDLRNADWTKQAWDLPPVGSAELQAFLWRQGKTLQDLRQLPVGQHNPQRFRAGMTKSHDVSEEARDARGRWTKTGAAEVPLDQAEPWQMSQSEFLTTGKGKEMTRNEAQIYHQRMVVEALADGKPVPDKAVQSYPILRQNLDQKIHAARIVTNPQPGDTIRVNNPQSPWYGNVYTVQDVHQENAYFKWIELNGNHPDGAAIPPFWVADQDWRSALPSVTSIMYGQKVPDTVAVAYNADRDAPLPDAKGDAIDPSISYNFRTSFVAKPQKILAAHLLANRLLDNVVFQQYAYDTAVDAVHSEMGFTDQLASPDQYQNLKREEEALLAGHGTLPSGLKEEYTYRAVVALIGSWANSSADDDALAVNLQRAVDDEFGLKSMYRPWLTQQSSGGSRSLGATTQYDAAEAYKEHGAAYRAFVRAQYEATQELLAKMGVKNVYLYRGVRFGGKMFEGTEKKMLRAARGSGMIAAAMQPASSFSTNRSTAISFATGSTDPYGTAGTGALLEASVPADRILTTPLTGSGCLDEEECIVLGGEPLSCDIEEHSSYTSDPQANRRGQESSDQESRTLWTRGQEIAAQLPNAGTATKLEDYYFEE